MAARANGGTSIGDETSAAATRPAARWSGTRSVRSIGRTAAASRRRASSREIVDVNGRTTRIPNPDARTPLSSRGLLHEMPELWQQQPAHCEPHCRLGSRQRYDDFAVRHAGACAAHHRRRSDLLVTEHPKELAESVETLLQQRVDRFVRAVARGDAGAAGRDDDFHVRIRELALDDVADE